MPIIEINSNPFFLTHSELHHLDLLRKFIYYTDCKKFKRVNKQERKKIKAYLLSRNANKKRPLIFNITDRVKKYASSELLFYASFKHSENPKIIGYSNYHNNIMEIDKKLYSYPFDKRTPLFAKSGIKLKDRAFQLNIDFSKIKRVFGCFDYTFIECDNFFVKIEYFKISVHHNLRLLKEVDTNFRCQGKVNFKSNKLIPRKTFDIYLDRELLYTNQFLEVYSDYEDYLSSNKNVITS